MTLAQVLSILFIIVDYGIKIVAIGVVPENRRPSSSSAWLLIILLLPVVGLPLFFLIGSPYVRGRRNKIQVQANERLELGNQERTTLPQGVEASPEITSLISLNRRLTALPCVTGVNEGLFGDAREYYAAMTEAVRGAKSFVHVEIYIMAWDETTHDFFNALREAVERGVSVKLLMDHLGSRGYPGWKDFKRRLTNAGINWHLMMPIDPLRGRWRRPDLRNHRKLMIVDGTTAFMGSHNLIDPTYDSAKNAEIGREWHDLSMQLSGNIVSLVQSVFAVDWYSETGETLTADEHFVRVPDPELGGPVNAMQIVPSGPGFLTEPNLRLFTSLIYLATTKIAITSPYFVPDEPLLNAITSAAYRGVRVDLFVGEKADQFMVGHAQRSYYRALLEAGVHIYMYPAPSVLHAKYLTIDDEVGVIGSSNLDFRSFYLDYEVSLMGFGGDLVASLQANDARYRELSKELTLQEWLEQPWYARYVDNVMRLTSALQ